MEVNCWVSSKEALRKKLVKPPQYEKNYEYLSWNTYEKLVGSGTKAGLFSTLNKQKLLEDWI